ncbi:MAG TPA: hypothetical protein VM118_09095 [Acidobacteriota bacterium]|nr:hypothetical protein [Acidobacteriota bacterium]
MPTDRSTAVRRRRWSGVICVIVLAATAGGCASHTQKLAAVRAELVADRPDRALTEFGKHKEKPSDLLYLLERGYLEQAAGNFAASNAAFEAAELRAEDLFTKSVTGELASLVTSDNVLPYRGYAHELVMIHYYRAFNYLALDLYDDALVEARKANRRLTELADEREGKNAYANDAFMQYLTGLLYEDAGERNDAAVSYRDAWRGYADYRSLYGVKAPDGLAAGLYRSLRAIGADDEAAELADRFPDSDIAADDANVIVFVETGFAPYLLPVDIILPIFDRDNDKRYRDCKNCEDEYASVLVGRYGDNIYSYSASGTKLDHVLRFSFPRMSDYTSAVDWVEVVRPDATTGVVPLEPAQPLTAIAHGEFNDRLPKLLLKTIARALVKEFARRTAKKTDGVLGALINIANVVTEQADTRSWLFLPGRIRMMRLRLPPGTATLGLIFHDANDLAIDRKNVTVTVEEGRISLVRVRSYQ